MARLRAIVRGSLLLCAATTIVSLLFGGVAFGATFNVTTTADGDNGACTASLCSLRDAVIAANAAATSASSTSNTINLAAGTYQITLAPTGNPGNEPHAGSFDLVANNHLTVNGAGSGATVIDANRLDRAFAVRQNASLSLSGLTIKNGLPYAQDVVNNSQNGGGVYSNGPLTLSNVVMSTNDSPTGNSGGGAIYLGTAATGFSIASSAFDNNSAKYSGGAIYYDPASSIVNSNPTITNTSFSHNTLSYYDYYGGAVDVEAGSLSINGSSFDHNTGYYGSAVNDNTSNGLVSLTNDTITANASYYGTVYGEAYAANLNLTNVAMTNNTSYYGGAIYTSGSNETLNVSGGTFSRNSAYDGAGIYLSSSGGTINFTNANILSNVSSDYGGGIYFNYGTLNVSGSTIANNSSAYYGGGLYLNNSSPVTVANSTISGNSSPNGGGVYISSASPLSMVNDTIAFNQASYAYGGGIAYPYDAGTGSTFENLIVAHNGGGDCGDGYVSDLGIYSTFNDNNSYTYDKGNNLDGDGSCVGNDSAPGNQRALEALLGPLADNGGPTQTHALEPGSPALGTASIAACMGAPVFGVDQRGAARGAGGHCDVGAFEGVAAATPSPPPATPAALPPPASPPPATAFAAFANQLNFGVARGAVLLKHGSLHLGAHSSTIAIVVENANPFPVAIDGGQLVIPGSGSARLSSVSRPVNSNTGLLVPSKGKRTLTVRLTSNDLRLITRKRHVTVQVVLKVSNPFGNHATLHQTYTLVAPKKKG